MSSQGPGPIYSLPPTIGYEKHDISKQRSPQFTIAGRLNVKNVNAIPGPSINTEGLTRYGKASARAFTIAPRSFVKDVKNIGPGPANYDVTKAAKSTGSAAPSYSLGRRDNFRFKNNSPGPNAYAGNIGKIKASAPAYSIGVKTQLKNKAFSPGPATYPAPNLRTVMHKAPEYSLKARTKIIDKSIVPGANAYDRTNYKPGKTSPSYSFGIRHSPRSPPFKVACDNV